MLEKKRKKKVLMKGPVPKPEISFEKNSLRKEEVLFLVNFCCALFTSPGYMTLNKPLVCLFVCLLKEEESIK